MITEANLRETYGIDVRILTSHDERTGKTLSFVNPVIESLDMPALIS